MTHMLYSIMLVAVRVLLQNIYPCYIPCRHVSTSPPCQSLPPLCQEDTSSPVPSTKRLRATYLDDLQRFLSNASPHLEVGCHRANVMAEAAALEATRMDATTQARAASSRSLLPHDASSSLPNITRVRDYLGDLQNFLLDAQPQQDAAASRTILPSVAREDVTNTSNQAIVMRHHNVNCDDWNSGGVKQVAQNIPIDYSDLPAGADSGVYVHTCAPLLIRG